MSVTTPAEVPDFTALGVHANKLALGISRFANLPTFNDPNISTKLNKIDDFMQNINTLKQDLTADLTASLTEVITRSFNDLETKLNNKLTKKLDDLETKLTKKLDDVETTLTKKLDDVGTEVKTLERKLSTNIAAR
ncbi:hypothetical protein ONZ43_g4472 [Nemania bipapillata]|uniref:Uncharacterized protein n=1 Tax=Nemania bipapillata TaxID=110536 RepID=A0ACC2IMK0_9PEZI|nr:hypothetical protein ONZ43_g4472 [Nemania bipapillata]